MSKQQNFLVLTNIFGTFGYISGLLLWMWVIILYLPFVLGSDQVRELLLPSGEPALSSPEPMAPSPVLMIVALIVTIIVMAVTVFILLRLPVVIARTGKAMTTKAVSSIEPLITHGRPLPPQERKRLTASLIKLIKLLLVLVPVVASFFTGLLPVALSYEIVMLVTAILAGSSMLWFGAQYISADLLGIKPEKLV